MSSKARLSTLTTAPDVSAVDESTDAVALILPTAGLGPLGGAPEPQAATRVSEVVRQSRKRDIWTYQAPGGGNSLRQNESETRGKKLRGHIERYSSGADSEGFPGQGCRASLPARLLSAGPTVDKK